jgi:hypothetical protein
MVAADSGKRGLFFSDFDEVAIDCRIPVGRCAACKASPLSLAGTSRTEPECDHRPFVFGHGTKDLPDHLSGRVAGIILDIGALARRSREHVPSVLSCFGEELFLDYQISCEPIEPVHDDAVGIVASEESERVGEACASIGHSSLIRLHL